MKQKRPAAMLSMEGHRNTVFVAAFSVLLFFCMHLWTESFSVGVAIFAVVLCIGRVPWRLAKERFCLPVLGLLAFMVLYGAAAVYSPFGGTAAREFSWMLVAFAVAALVLFRVERRHIPGILWGLASVCAVISLLCTSSAYDGPIFQFFCALTNALGSGEIYSEIENIVGRVNGIYNDANVSASILALGTLIALYLAHSEKKWWKRLLACMLMGTSAMGILLSLSRGAVLCFGLSLLVWFVALNRDERLRFFLLMVFSAAVTTAASMAAMSAAGMGSVLQNLLAIASGGLIFLLDWAVGDRLACFFVGHNKAMLTIAAVVVVTAVVYALAAIRITGSYTMGDSGFLSRSLKLAPGSYTVSGDWDGDIQAQVISRSRLDVLQSRGHYETLFSGPLKEASFTVTGEEFELTIQLAGIPGDILRQVVFSDGTEVPLGYPLLPGALADRLQGDFFSGNSFLLRIQFDKDAWTIFTKSPLLGHGLGSTDNLYPAIQSFYYTSRYAHNHILQVMADMGLVGLAAFLTFLGGVLWLLVRRLRQNREPLAALLLACWVMMNSHSLMEINFSLQAYQCMAFVLLLLPVVLYGKPLSERAPEMGGSVVCAVVWLFLVVFGGLLGLRQAVQFESAALRASNIDQLMSALDSYAKRDVFDPAPYQLEYVAIAVSETGGQYDAKMLEYVERIRNSGNYPACSGLPEHYYLPIGDFQGLFACSRECLVQRRSYAEVWNGQVDFYRIKVLPAAGEAHMTEFTEGLLAFRDLLEGTNQDRIEQILLTEENQAFVDAVCGGASYASLTGQSG